MNVTIDARMAFHTGIGRYIRSLCRALLAQSSVHHLSLMLNPLNSSRIQQEIGPAQVIPFTAKVYSFTEQLQSPWLYQMHAKQTSLFHCPHYNVPWFLPPNSVVTVHDLTHFQFPQYFGKYRVHLAFRLLQRAVQRAGHLIAVSHATQNVLEAMLPASKGKTTVIHHGVSAAFRPLPETAIATFKRTHKLGRFFLYVGNTKPHKNLARLLQAFRQLKFLCGQIDLVLLGIEPTALTTSQDGVYCVSNVQDNQLVYWYNAAEALVFPSLNEGFGLPALESMACGTPVISSNIAALHEVVADAGLLINPCDVEAWTQAMHQLISNHGLRQLLRASGLSRAHQFSWTVAAQQTLHVYRQVMTQGQRL